MVADSSSCSWVDGGVGGGGGLLGGDEEGAREDDGGFEDGEVARGVRLEDERAEASAFEESFEDDGTSEEGAELGADGGDDGADRCGERVEPEDAAVASSFCSGDTEELSARDFVERGTRDARDLGGEREGEQTTREDEAGDAGVGIAGERDDAEARGEREREDGRECEKRRRGDGGGDVIDPGAARAEPRAGAEDGGGDADERAEQDGEAGERGGGERGVDDARDGGGAGAANGVAEIERDESADEACILQPHGLVEVEARAEEGALGFARLIAEDEGGGIAGQETEREEDERREGEDHDRRFRRASEDDRGEAASAVHPPPSAASVMAPESVLESTPAPPSIIGALPASMGDGSGAVGPHTGALRVAASTPPSRPSDG